MLKAAGVDMNRETVMIFTNLANRDPKKLAFSHKSPYYADGDHGAARPTSSTRAT